MKNTAEFPMSSKVILKQRRQRDRTTHQNQHEGYPTEKKGAEGRGDRATRLQFVVSLCRVPLTKSILKTMELIVNK